MAENATEDIRIGDKMPDGTVYAGISPETGKRFYAMPEDAPLTSTFNDARTYASKLDAHGHRDWRVPETGELNMLFDNRAAVSGFKENTADTDGWYWSNSANNFNGGWLQDFSHGKQMNVHRFLDASLRCVR